MVWPIVLTVLVVLSWPTLALAQQSETDFRGFKLGAQFQQAPGYEYQGEIVAGPGVRVGMYYRTYDEETVTANSVGVYKGRIVFKQQISAVPSKNACAEGIVMMVEGLMAAGIPNWRKTWREDYQVPVYKADVGNVLAKITCRTSQAIWFLEYTQTLRDFNLLH